MSSSTSSGREEPGREVNLAGREIDPAGNVEPGREVNLAGNAEPGQALNDGEATLPRQAATVILLRGGEHTLELLLVKRTEKARFMGGVWVFPGGAVDEDDPPSRGDAHRAAAVRELAEEAGVAIADAGALVEFSRWITPEEVAVRFDTRFFLAELPDGQEPKVDGEECVEEGWFTPQGALDAHGREEIVLVFPTIKHLEQLGAFSNVVELLRYAAGREVLPVQPKVWFDGEVARVLLPGEPGYE
jgi:8-oxo-dGTP pyrophosphatase MutT (NUDIX family)